MAGTEQQHVQITLRTVDELFVAPDLDPFNGRFQTLSGVDQIVAQIEPRSKLGRVRVAIHLPAGQISDGLDARCEEALRGYAAARIRQIDLEQARLNLQGRRELEFGLLFLVVCFFAAGWVEALDAIPEFLVEVLSHSLIIVGWIALWHPVDLLIFERWIVARDRRVYERIRDAEVVLRAGD